MGLFSSDTRRQNELSQLVSRLLNGDSFLEEDDYTRGIPALLLSYAANPGLLPWERLRAAYEKFAKVCNPDKRFAVLKTLSAFSVRMQGLDSRVWEPVFLCDPELRLRNAAAHAAVTLSPVSMEHPYQGLESWGKFIVDKLSPAGLNGAFLTCDLRLLPLLLSLWESFPEGERRWGDIVPVMSVLSLEFIISRIENSPCSEEISAHTEALARMPYTFANNPPFCLYHPFPAHHPDYSYPQVIDAVTPIPSWKYPDTEPQVLHTWTCPEFLPRFLPRIEKRLSAVQREKIALAWLEPFEEF